MRNTSAPARSPATSTRPARSESPLRSRSTRTIPTLHFPADNSATKPFHSPTHSSVPAHSPGSPSRRLLNQHIASAQPAAGPSDLHSASVAQSSLRLPWANNSPPPHLRPPHPHKPCSSHRPYPQASAHSVE